ncbi:MAG TPA: glycosyltransferase family 39 protein [Chthoniobacterales bacterium]|nr:glycosyltransferase family 39 protein [Chthoniobacterales bacterium]
METRSTSKFFSGPAIILYLAGAKLLFHLLTANRYGIFRDELYYLACGEHLDWGYVDQPPLIALVAWIARHLFGDSLVGLRLIPAVAGAATVWLTGKLARDMGGAAFAQILAALAVICVPIYLILHHWLTMNAFEPLIWAGCAWCVVRAINRNAPRYWIWFGVLAGIGMETKYTTAFFVFALVVALLLTGQRRLLVTKEFCFGAVIAFAIFLPNLIWLARHNFPFLELMHNIRQTHRDVVRGPIAFVLDQAQIMNPILFPLWLGGLIWWFFSRDGERFRVLGFSYITLLATFVVLRGKNYYLSPTYPVLFAAGAIAIERITTARFRWSGVAYALLMVGSIIVLAPTVSPILSPEGAIAYQQKLGLEPPKAENQQTGPLPQYFADEFGWREMTEETARVYKSLPVEEQARTAIFANNYGEAGAIDFFGPQLGLPKSICNHQSYWLWGPRNYDGSIVIVLGSDGTGDREHFRSVEAVGHVEHPYSRRDEHFDIFLCRGFTGDLQQAWTKLKKYN